MAAARQMYGGLRIAAEGGAGAPAPLPFDAQRAFLSVFIFIFFVITNIFAIKRE